MLRELFLEQRKQIEFFFDHFDLQRAESVLSCFVATPGIILLTGVGKSGFVAEKIAMTLVSTGTRALYSSPTNFLHGDIGIISKDDLVFILSKSGESEELLRLIPFIKKRESKLVACVSNGNSRLAQQADELVVLPMEKELCPFGLTPTTSTEIQLIFGNLLAVFLMKHKQFPLASYGENHPSGAIGKKVRLLVRDLMIPEKLLPLCSPSDTVREILPLFSEKRVGCILIADHERNLLGIFTDGDLRRSLEKMADKLMNTPIGEVMTAHPLVIDQNSLAWDGLRLMQHQREKWIHVLPVLDDSRIVGLLRMHDIIHSGLS